MKALRSPSGKGGHAEKRVYRVLGKGGGGGGGEGEGGAAKRGE